MEFWFVLAIVGISIVSVLVYAVLAVFFPEWVGITGKVALEAERSHREESAEVKSEAKDPEPSDH